LHPGDDANNGGESEALLLGDPHALRSTLAFENKKISTHTRTEKRFTRIATNRKDQK
jgi:hypothetical protein